MIKSYYDDYDVLTIEVYYFFYMSFDDFSASFRGGIDLEPRGVNRWESTRDILEATYDPRNYVPP